MWYTLWQNRKRGFLSCRKKSFEIQFLSDTSEDSSSHIFKVESTSENCLSSRVFCLEINVQEKQLPRWQPDQEKVVLSYGSFHHCWVPGSELHYASSLQSIGLLLYILFVFQGPVTFFLASPASLVITMCLYYNILCSFAYYNCQLFHNWDFKMIYLVINKLKYSILFYNI